MSAPAPAPPINPVAASVRYATTVPSLPDGIDWRTGIGFEAWCVPVRSRPTCGTGDAGDPTSPTPVTFAPVELSLWASCDWLDDASAFDEHARAVLDARSSAGLAAAMQSGLTDDGATDNPSLASAATSLGVHVESRDALALALEAALECSDGQQVFLHVPVRLLVPFLDSGVVRPEGDFYRGPAGSLVVVDAGYDPTVAPTGEATALDVAWLYATGRVEHALGDLVVTQPTDTHALNTHQVMVRRAAIWRFDPCCVFAAAAPAVNGTGS